MKEKKKWDSSIFDDSDMYIVYMRILQFKNKINVSLINTR